MEERQRIFISGEWRPEPAEKFKDEAFRLGVLLAEDGFDLTCGPGSGISKYVLVGFPRTSGRNSNNSNPNFDVYTKGDTNPGADRDCNANRKAAYRQR